jgi:hypothetical protein
MTQEELQKAIAEGIATATAPLNDKLAEAMSSLEKMGAENASKPQASGQDATAEDKKGVKKSKKSRMDDDDDDDGEPDEDDVDKRAAWRNYVKRKVASETAKAVAAAIEETRDSINKTYAEDEVVRVGDIEFRKSQMDPQMFELVKVQQAEIQKGRDNLENAELLKIADSPDYVYLPLRVEDRAKILKVMKSIGDKAVKESLEKALKAGNAAIRKGFTEFGRTTGAIEGSPEDKLNQLSKAYAKAHNVSEAEAYNKVLDTAEGKELYAQHKRERPATRGFIM